MEQMSRGLLQNTFTCELCGLSTPFTYFGQKPPNTRAIVLLEECFVTKDPFSPDKERFLVLGSNCSLCGSSACVGSISGSPQTVTITSPPCCGSV
uniref:Cysteine-rich DPF motif domain-containing protein 1 n=1 Tax=Gadus morhua TaxID=8049 RepID=A0A8C4YX46_GADMO